MKRLSIAVIAAGLAACTQAPQVEWIKTTEGAQFQTQPALALATSDAHADVSVTDQTQQTVEGFGGCFNELGWTTLSTLSQADQDVIFNDLFGKDGMNFTVCRMPVAANDFARKWYSYNETAGDFAMDNFTIANDRETLIPYIKAAMKVNPNIRLWASPWCPPTWMKDNKSYACNPAEVNDLFGQKYVNREGSNMFIQEPAYLEAYALYFRKFIEAYRAEGIKIAMVAPQNEFNSCQVFPSCTWTAAGLDNFVGNYLGPQMKELGVDMMFGTMERENYLLVDSIMKGAAGKYITEVGFQWAGKESIAKIHEEYPNLKLMQSESECGNGQNSWEHCFYIASLMKHYFKYGVSSYMYWNISLDKAAANPWKWRQNSLISVDTEAKTYRYNPEYYLMRHYCHFVQPGAKHLVTEGDNNKLVAFVNPDQSIVVVVYNEDTEAKTMNISVKGKTFAADLAAQSINTYVVK